MTSNDIREYISLEEYRATTGAIMRHLSSIDQRLTAIQYEQGYTARDVEHLQTSVYWGFAIMALVVAFVGYMVSLAPMFRDMYRDAREARNDRLKREMREIAREEFARLRAGE